MITLKAFVIIVTLLLTFTLYISLGINDFQPQKKQWFALLPLLLLLLTLYRMDNIPPVIYDKVENDNTYETPIQQEEIIKAEVSVTATHSKPIEMVERQLQVKDQKVIIPTIQNEIKSSQIETGSLLKQTTKSLPFVVVGGLILSIINPQTVYQ